MDTRPDKATQIRTRGQNLVIEVRKALETEES